MLLELPWKVVDECNGFGMDFGEYCRCFNYLKLNLPLTFEGFEILDLRLIRYLEFESKSRMSGNPGFK